MSGKGSIKGSTTTGGKRKNAGGRVGKKGDGTSSGANSQQHQQEPTIVSGYQYHMYAQNSDRYAYIGKDEDGEPEFIDYGSKGG